MKIRIGRHALSVIVEREMPAMLGPLPGADDAALANLACAGRVDFETARWQGLGYLYGGQHPSARVHGC